MDLAEIKKELEKIQKKGVNGNIKLLFTEKTKKGNYVSYNPQISNKLQKKILENILETLANSEYNLPQVAYNVLGAPDGYLETKTSECISSLQLINESFELDNVCEVGDLKTSKISFFCLKVKIADDCEICFFSKYTKMQKLNRNIRGRILGGEYQELDDEIMGIHSDFDVVLYKGEFLIIKRFSFESIFNLKDEFITSAKKALSLIKASNKINNFSDFEKDCLNSTRTIKKLNKIMSDEDNFSEALYDVKGIELVKAEFNLDIDISKDGKIDYMGKHQLAEVTNILSDAYYKTMLRSKTGVDLLK